MANFYEDHLGTTFGFTVNLVDPVAPTDPPAGIIPEFHSFRDFGLFPASKPEIETPEIQEHYVEVPGRTGLLDYTESLTNDVRYYNRQGKFEFIQTGGRQLWDATYHKLKNNLHGRCKKILIDEENDGYYYGRLTVETPKYDDKRGLATFTIKANLEPYKRALTTNSEDWLWDPFNFETGFIPQPCECGLTSAEMTGYIAWNGFDVVTPTTNVGMYGNTMPLVPVVRVNAVAVSGQTPVVQMMYPNDEMVYPITTVPSISSTPPAGWSCAELSGNGEHTDEFPDFIIREQPGVAVFKIKSGTANEADIELDFRAGWL